MSVNYRKLVQYQWLVLMRIWGQQETHAGHANIMIWALFSQLKSRGEASCTLSGDNKRPIVCA